MTILLFGNIFPKQFGSADVFPLFFIDPTRFEMNRQQLAVGGFRGLVATGLVGMLVACGGGGGGDDDGPLADSVVARGVITEFGSVVMHGVRYETENSRIVSADDGSLIVENPATPLPSSALLPSSSTTMPRPRYCRTSSSLGFSMISEPSSAETIREFSVS